MRKTDELVNGCMAKAGDGEMTFVLLARDPAAPAAIMEWVRLRLAIGKNGPEDPELIEALECARVMMAERSRSLQAALTPGETARRLMKELGKPIPPTSAPTESADYIRGWNEAIEAAAQVARAEELTGTVERMIRALAKESK